MQIKPEPFYTEHKAKIMLNKTLRGKAPPEWTGDNWRQYYKGFNPESVSPKEFAHNVFQGFSFTPVYINGRRKIENFSEAHHIAFDFDEAGASLDYLMRDESLAWYFSSFAYSTPSSTDDHPKSRVVFVFDEPIKSADRFKEIYTALAWHFAQDGSICDPQCKDPLRLYYGSPGAKMIGNWSVLTDDVCQEYIDLYNKNKPKKQPAQKKKTIKPSMANGQAMAYLERLADNVRTAPDGGKHAARIYNGRAAGGYVVAGYISRMDAESVLIEAAVSNSSTPEKARQEIIESIEYGMNDPLYIEVEEVTSIEDLIL